MNTSCNYEEYTCKFIYIKIYMTIYEVNQLTLPFVTVGKLLRWAYTYLLQGHYLH
jgi:hypothetical protein